MSFLKIFIPQLAFTFLSSALLLAGCSSSNNAKSRDFEKFTGLWTPNDQLDTAEAYSFIYEHEFVDDKPTVTIYSYGQPIESMVDVSNCYYREVVELVPLGDNLFDTANTDTVNEFTFSLNGSMLNQTFVDINDLDEDLDVTEIIRLQYSPVEGLSSSDINICDDNQQATNDVFNIHRALAL